MHWVLGEVVRDVAVVHTYYHPVLGGQVWEMSNGRIFAERHGEQYLLQEAPNGNPYEIESPTHE